MRVLIVDDNIELLRSIEAAFIRAGHDVATAESGRSLKKIIVSSLQKKTEFDFLITDFFMPDIDGLEIIRSIRRFWPHVHVIMITAYGDDLLREKLETIGDCKYLDKPFNPETLLDAVNETHL